MGSFASFKHYLTTLGFKTRLEFRPPTMVFWPTVRGRRSPGTLWALFLSGDLQKEWVSQRRISFAPVDAERTKRRAR